MKAGACTPGVPVFLNLSGKKVLVLGEGAAARSAAFRILEGGGQVLWAGFPVPIELKHFQALGRLKCSRGLVSEKDLKKVVGVFPFHPTARENRRVRGLAKKMGRWVGGIEGDSGSDMLLGPMIWRGPLLLGFWMFSGEPWLKRWAWRRLLKQWGQEWEGLLKRLLKIPGGTAVDLKAPRLRPLTRRIPSWLSDLRRKRDVKVEREIAGLVRNNRKRKSSF